MGAEEANSLESYKKKVPEIIKHPKAGLSAHSPPETECKPLVKFLTPQEHQRFKIHIPTRGLRAFHMGVLLLTV